MLGRIEVHAAGQLHQIAITSKQTSDTMLLFMHGLGCAKECFDSAFKAKTLEPFSLYSFDWLGHSESDKPQDFSYKLEDQAAVCLQIVEQLPHTRISIVAHSMGAGIGLLVAQELKNLDYFISVEGLLGGGAFSKRIAAFSEDAFIREGYGQFLQELQTAPQPAFHEWAKWYEQASPIAIYKSAQSMVTWAQSGKLFDIFNALEHKAYLYSDNDNIEELRSRFSGVQTYRIPDAGHFIMQDNPDELYEIVARLITKP